MTGRSARSLALAACALPLFLGALVAAALAIGGGGVVLQVRYPLATVFLVVGAALSVLALLAAGSATLWRRRRADGYEDGVRAERDAHRRFLARLDHELKNPITAIRTALAAEPATEGSAALRTAASQADRLGSLIGELRALASLETRPIERARVDIAAVAREEISALQDELAAHGAHRHITTAFPTAPWPLPAVLGDVDLLSVAVRNLLVNAAKYSGQGARIEVRGTEQDGCVVLEVADTGRGIAAADLTHVWDELWRGAQAREIDGTGLGLSLVRIVAERHGGSVGVRSESGRGTAVQLRVPAQQTPPMS